MPVVEATGHAAAKRGEGAHLIEQAMAAAVAKALSEGVTDGIALREVALAARASLKAQLAKGDEA